MCKGINTYTKFPYSCLWHIDYTLELLRRLKQHMKHNSPIMFHHNTIMDQAVSADQLKQGQTV